MSEIVWVRIFNRTLDRVHFLEGLYAAIDDIEGLDEEIQAAWTLIQELEQRRGDIREMSAQLQQEITRDSIIRDNPGYRG